VLEVDAAVDVKEAPHAFMSAIDKDMFDRCKVRPSSRADLTDDPALYDGMPIGLQVIGRRGEDEAVIRMAEIVDEALKKAKEL
jgi:amidase